MSELRSIEAEVDVPEVVTVPHGAETVPLDVRVTLRNNGGEDVVVHATSADDRHFWHLFDGNHREIQRGARSAPGRVGPSVEDGVHSYHTATVAAGREVHATQQIEVQARKLKPGRLYTLRVESFGHIAEATFTAVGEPRLVPLRPARKKPAGRKAARKTAVRKKAVKRTRAKKAGGKSTGR